MGKLAKLGEDGSMAALSDKYMFALLLHSIALGLILVVATFYEIKYLSEYPIKSRLELDTDDEGEDSGKNSPEKVSSKGKKTSNNLEIFLGSSNLLFLCVGLTGVMLLVNNSLARAFAIAAALSLTRFRIKLDQKSINASLLFAILAGMACGLAQVRLAWMATGIYLALLIAILIMVNLLKPKSEVALEKSLKPGKPAPPETPAS